MYDKDLYRKVIDVTCSGKELTATLKDIDGIEFDCENSFDKYFNLRSILVAIMKYKSGEINVKYFTNWVKLYYHVLVGGIDNKAKPQIDLKGSLKWAILDNLSRLMFYNEFYNTEDLKLYINAFLTLNKVYREMDECSAVFAEYEGVSYDVAGIIFNSTRKYFMKIFMRSEKNLFDELQLFDLSELGRQEEELRTIKYYELNYLVDGKTSDEI